MSRFRPRMTPSGMLAVPPPLAPVVPAEADMAPTVASGTVPDTPSATVAVPGESGSIMETIGFWFLCAYIVSWAINDWALRLFDVRGYVSAIALVLMPALWLFSGTALQGLKHAIGRWWLLFILLLLVDAPFSVWRGGTFELLVNSIPRSFMMLFYAASLAGSLRRCRQLLYANAVLSLCVLLTCAVFGSYSEDGRFTLPGGAGFYGNSNDLAMQLLMGITQFVYLFSQNSVVAKAISAIGIAASIPFILSTGSRGCTIAAIAYGLLILYTSRNRIRVVAVVMALALVGLVFASSEALHRVSGLFGDDEAESSAMASQMSRLELLRRSVVTTFEHPLVGVGPGQFPVYMSEDAKAKGEWAQWLGTHNAFTQVSSECGIPAFVCYFAVNLLCLTTNLKLWRRFRDRSDGQGFAALSLALLSGSLVYTVCSFFFHMAYTGPLPSLAGLTIALQFAADKEMPAAEPAAA